MTDQPKSKGRPKGSPPTPGSWPKGVSGNPTGRPRHGLAFAEKVRERVNPDMVIDLAMRVAEDETLSPAERLTALWPLVDRGFIKPPQTIDATLTNGNASSSYSLDHLSLDERRDMLAKLRAGKRLESDAPRLVEPQATDDKEA